MSTARDTIFFNIMAGAQVSELWLATLVSMTGLSNPLGISSFLLCLFDPMTKLVQSKWLNTDLILKNCSKNLSQYPIKQAKQASSITLCLQYKYKVHVEQCLTCTSIQWSQRTTIIMWLSMMTVYWVIWASLPFQECTWPTVLTLLVIAAF